MTSLLRAPLQLFLSSAKEEPELYSDLEAHDLCPASPATSSLLLYHLDHSVHLRTLAPLGPPQCALSSRTLCSDVAKARSSYPLPTASHLALLSHSPWFYFPSLHLLFSKTPHNLRSFSWVGICFLSTKNTYLCGWTQNGWMENSRMEDFFFRLGNRIIP